MGNETKNEIAELSETETSLVNAVKQCHLAAEMKNDTVKSLRLAAGMAELRTALEQAEVKKLIMGFMNLPIGFVTDKDPAKGKYENGKFVPNKPYHENVVLNCALEALTAGAYLHGNEFNIIAGRTYFAQSFFVRKVREYCQANSVERHFSFNTQFSKKSGNQNEFIVKGTIAWKFPDWTEKKVHNVTYYLVGMTRDQVEGKAKKRAHQWLYNELTDNNFAAVPDEEEPFDMPTGDPSAAPNKPEFEMNPDPIEYLCDKYSVIDAIEFFNEVFNLEIPADSTTGAIGAFFSDENYQMLKNNISDFERQLKEFSGLRS